MTGAETDLRDWMAARSRDIAARLDNHPDGDVLFASRQGPLDVLAPTLRGRLDLRWTDAGELHARPSTAISVHWYAFADADGVPDAELCWRWVVDLGMAPDGVEVGEEARYRVAAAVVGIAEREREQALQRWSVQTVEQAMGGRWVQTWACLVDDRGVLVGHERRHEPTRADIARHEQALAALSPTNRLMGGATTGPRWPVDRPLTPEFVREQCVSSGLLQRDEAITDWSEVVDAIRALVHRS